ncbi:MAG: flagellar biosynthetic protein FliO [Kineosporiaceae bacterium]|nr:flagellar biosynthetic protein FliO [Kineosporiaceae bacterium]
MNAADDLAMLGRVTLSLLVVTLLAVILARLARRASVRGGGVGLTVIDRVGLSRDAALAVVRVGDDALVLGVTAQSVSLLTTLDAAQLTGAVPGPVPGALAGTGSTLAEPATRHGSVLDRRTWRQGLEALRDLTARR